MVSKVAGLAASNRSIFEFLKSSGDDGFRAYIQKNGIEKGWKWVTPDYLWDYFFVNNLGGKKELSQMAVDTIKHYNKVKSQISDERMLRVFKTAMLLLATIGSGRSLKKSKGSKGLQSTEKSLYDCFAGALSKEEIHEYLEILSSEPLNLIVLAKDPTEVSRIELPYAGTGGELEAEIEKIKKVNTPAKMLGTDMLIGASLKKQLADGDKAVLKRLAIDTCWGSTQQIDYKYGELKKTVEKTFHKFGMLVIAVPDSNEIERVKKRAAELISKDDTHRMMVCVLRYPLKQELFDEWYNLTANASLAQKTAASVNADSYKTQAEDVLGAWVSTALGKDMDIIYGDVVTHTHSKNGILSEYEKIVFKVFPAAPETIIRKNTLYKSSGTVPAYYGVSKTTLDTKNLSDPKQRNFNQQWQDCVDILQDNEENIFDAEKIEDIIEMHETRVSRSMAAMCNTINQSMTSGTVFLTDLWEALQREIGFYDTGICCYLLGFAMHYYTGKYTWFDGNNAHKLDMDSVPVMVVSMVQGKASGMKLSSESDIEKRFKDITRRIFSLSPDEAGDIYDCRKNIKVKITSLGQPLWAIKYIDEKEFAGVKQAICDIIDQYSNFVLENGNQNDVIEDIVNLIKVNAKVYISMLAGILKAPWDMAQGMKNYIFEISPKAKDICNKYGFSVDDLINTLARSLEEEKWQWREGEIAEATDNLLIDLSLVGIVNSALDGKAKTVDKIRDTLANYLDYIQIPGCVYASLSDPWAETIDVLHDIAINKWASLSKGDKEHILEGLNKSIKLALENISHPINVLKQYITTNKMGEFSDDEYLKILESLPKEPYSQSEHSFKTNIRKTIEDLDYSKKAKQILEIWKTKTNTKSVEEWSVQNIMPIKWVCPDYNSIFSVVRSLNLHERVDLGRLENALVQIEDADLSILSNKEKVDRQFVINVSSEKYMNLLLPHLVELKNYLQDCVTRDYNKWDTRIVDIRKKVDAYIVNDLRAEVSEKAKERVKEIDDINTIRDKLYSILEHSPEACLLLLDE